MAEQRIQTDGALFGYLRATRPGFYKAQGWIELSESPHHLASPHAVLAHLHQMNSDVSCLAPTKPSPLQLRHWRHFERDALARLYTAHCRHAFGATMRDADYWNWLIARHAFERIYVALDGPPKAELDPVPTAVVGYAVATRSRLVELMIDPRRPEAAATLISRFCGDAIERNRYQIRLDAPPDSPSRGFFPESSGGRSTSADSADGGRHAEPVIMVRVLHVGTLVSRLHDLFLRRIANAGRRLPVELGFCDESQQVCLLRVDENASRVVGARRARQYLTCTRADLMRLLLGNLDVAESIDQGRIKASSQGALATAGMLLPKSPLWFPPLDDLTGG
ncbi:MAG: sterol carrier protein domain-containing protein [Planctomycetes bacterium]|nr:sterol carrier protein domain-containing protein [Planctomycetota bacterium]